MTEEQYYEMIRLSIILNGSYGGFKVANLVLMNGIKCIENI